jgi:hypothetical protein
MQYAGCGRNLGIAKNWQNLETTQERKKKRLGTLLTLFKLHGT